MGIMIGLASVASLVGAFFYNKLRAKYYGVIGVGGSYISLIGIMLLVEMVFALFGGGLFDSSAEMVVGIIFLLAGIGYLVYVMITRCDTVMERVLLPFGACLIALGFCWRLLFSIIFKIPLSNGAPEVSDDTSETTAFQFPSIIHDDSGETWELISCDSEKAEYRCRKDGNRTTVWCTGGYLNMPNGWRAN